MIAVDPHSVEWLETNGAGSYALSTVCGRLDRRYHGLLVAAIAPPVSRYVFLSKLEEELETKDGIHELGTNSYPGVTHPAGHRLISATARDPFPRITWKVPGATLERMVAMLQGERTVAVRYRLVEGPTARLVIRPLVAFRSDHSLARKRAGFDGAIECSEGRATVRPVESLPELHFTYPAGEVRPGHGWYYNFQYAAEKERGLDFEEDLHNPFGLAIALEPGKDHWIVASLDRARFEGVPAIVEREVERRRGLVVFGEPALDALAAAGDAFLVRRGRGMTVIAGYPWFSDWGRDAMVSVPGLCLHTGRIEDAKACLRTFVTASPSGFVPNYFADDGGPSDDHSVDATLWAIDAAGHLWDRGGDSAKFVLEELFPAFEKAFDTWQSGGPHGVRIDEEGWLRLGDPKAALTWMDARIDGVPVTPRAGRPIEIQALFWKSLARITTLAQARGRIQTVNKAHALVRKISERFETTYWLPDRGHFSDVIDEQGRPDRSLRPNQVLALAVAPELFSKENARRALKKVREQLLTPFGLRTLSPKDPNYRGSYVGPPRERDSAYHQGTAWPWLIGPFARAWARAFGDREGAVRFLEPLVAAIRRPFPGTLPEILDGDSPWRPRGCAAQAWSVAETLRAAAELRAPKPQKKKPLYIHSL